MSRNFLICSKVVKDPFEVPEGSLKSEHALRMSASFLMTLSPAGFLTLAPGSFPTGLSHVPPRCESILGLKVEAVQGKQVSLEWTETSGGLWECGTTLEFLSPFLWRAPPLEMRRESREFFPDHAGKGSLLSS